jgi:hypothetical protein
MFGAGKNMHRLYGVALYLVAVMFLYGKKEVLPTALIKEYSNVKNEFSLKYEKKRDPKVAIDYQLMLRNEAKITEAGASGGQSMYAVGKALKKKQKV